MAAFWLMAAKDDTGCDALLNICDCDERSVARMLAAMELRNRGIDPIWLRFELAQTAPATTAPATAGPSPR
jgi:hypothetical protein